MRRRDYLYQGLCIRAEFPLPEWELFARAPCATVPDVSISLGALPEFERIRGSNDQPSAEEYRFSVPGMGFFRVSEGRQISVAPLPGIKPAELQPWLAGPAWAALCYQRGLLITHASAVNFEDGAVAFCGRAGSGKSTTAAHLHALGYAMISDDLCRIEISGGAVFVHPSTPRLRLRSDALVGLETQMPVTPLRTESRLEKTLLWTPNWSRKPLPLKAIYLLNWGEHRLRRLTGSAALHSFLQAASYRGDLIDSMERSASFMSSCIELLRRIPLWELSRPQEVERIGEIVKLITNRAAPET